MKPRANSPEHEKVMTFLRLVEQGGGSRPRWPSDIEIMDQTGLPSETRVREILADLADARRIQINRQGRKGRAFEIFADRFDDSDDITRRIRQQQASITGVRFENAENSLITGQEPQKTSPSGCESSSTITTVGNPDKIAGSSTQKPQKTATRAMSTPVAGNTPRIWPAAKGMPPSIENRNPAELNLDDSYQRSTDNSASQTLIKKIAHGWDWRMCLPLVVSKRDDGSLWVIDGQHRLAAALMRGDIPFLPCCVGVYGTVADEAAMFVAMNRSRKPMNRLDDFHAAIASGDAEAIEIRDLVTGAGFTVSRRTGSQSWLPGEVAFTASIAKVLRKHGPKPCSYALQTMAEAFPDEVLFAGASMFTALTKMVTLPPPDFDPDRLFSALLKGDQRYWASYIEKVKGAEERALRMKDALLMAYEDEGVQQ